MSVELAAHRWDRVYLTLYALYFVVGLAARLLGWIHGDAVWFVDAARRVLDGSFDLYSYRAMPSTAPPLGSTYAYTPFMALLIAPFVWIADVTGWGAVGAQRLMAVPLLVADVLAMDQLRRLARVWRPAVDERFLFLGIVATLGLTGFWIVTAFDGHNEGLVLLFVLLALRVTPRSLLWGGVCAGLALAAKHTAALLLIPLGLVVLAGGLNHDDLNHENAKGRKTRNETDEGRETNGTEPGVGGAQDDARIEGRAALGGLRAAAVWGGAAAGVFAAFLLPAVLRNFEAVWYAFVLLPTRLVMFGAGLPIWIDRALQAVLPAGEYALRHEELIRYANWLLIGSLALPAAVVSWARRAGQPVRWGEARLLALVVLGGLAQVLLSKWVTGHYYQVPLALVLLWDVVRTAPHHGQVVTFGLHSFPWVGLGAALAFRSITQIGTPDLPAKDALLFILFAALAVIVWRAGATRAAQ
jgi:hypothetical protein